LESLALSHFDYIVIGIIALSGLIAFFRGFVQETLSLLLWIIAFAAAMFLNAYLDPYFINYIDSPEIRRILTIITVFVGIIFVGGLLIKFLRGLVHWSGMGGLDRLLGVLFGFLRGMLLIVVIYLVLPSDFKQSPFITDSKSSKYLKKYAPMAEKFFKSMISDKNSVMLKSNISTIYETT
jgi:membrane protein required for colicin V production|tara:strand:+ start:7362 stop:7901 length:540 start_codon:yes stop_codon:yes gene_type:complete